MLRTFFLLFLFCASVFSQDSFERGGFQEEPVSIEDEAAHVSIKESYLSNVMSSDAKKFVAEFLRKNPFSEVPAPELRALVSARLNGIPFGKMLDNNPKLMDMFVELLRDKKAIPSLLSLINKPEKVKQFGIFALAVFVMVFILNLFNSKGNIFKRILIKMSIGLTAFTCNLVAIYVIFGEEIQPTLNIVLKYFHL